MSSLRFTAALLAFSLGAAACIGPDDDQAQTPTTDLSGSEILLTSSLETVDSCDALLDRLRSEGSERVGPYGFGGGFYGPLVDFAMEDDMAMEEAAMDSSDSDAGGRLAASPASTETSAQSSEGAADGTFSETNNQEEGVDEADLVKTDGSKLVTITGNRLRVIDVTGNTPELTNTVKLPDDFYGGELFLNGDTALLMTSGWTNAPFMSRTMDTGWYPGSPTGRIMEINLDRGTIERTLEFEGSYLSAREIDGSIRIVMSAAENRFNFLFPSNEGATEQAEKANRDLIENSTIDMWIPTFRISEDGETISEGPIVDCDRVHLPTEFAGFGSLVVLTADINDGLNINDALSVFTDGQTIYASQDRLAVSTPRWPEFDNNGEPIGEDGYRSAIHSFDISDPVKTSYAASGSVRGYLLNQYSMSEHNGYLRVATTDGSPWWGGDNSESFVTVFEENGNELSQIGQVGGLGEGEQIFAVRFLGDIGYVVTFRQVDPLYTIDLSNPANPVVTGELKIPGVSDYLHSYDEDHLVAVGRDGTDEGLEGGVVLSLFDVSDMENPTMTTKLRLGPQSQSDTEWVDSYSPVAGDARAFNIWGDTVIVPVGWWSYNESPNSFQENNGNSAVLVKVNAEDGTLTKIGEIGHPKTSECEGGFTMEEEAFPEEAPAPEVEVVEEGVSAGEDAEASFTRPEEAPPAEEDELIRVPNPEPGEPEQYCFSYQPDIRRSVIIGENIYTISDAGVAVNQFDGLDSVTWIPFEG
ncbi:MAG: beta-propeller domain-containing protein [Acidimicrobiales bacterium]